MFRMFSDIAIKFGIMKCRLLILRHGEVIKVDEPFYGMSK